MIRRIIGVFHKDVFKQARVVPGECDFIHFRTRVTIVRTEQKHSWIPLVTTKGHVLTKRRMKGPYKNIWVIKFGF